MKTREEIRMQFFTENNGAYWTNSQEEPDIDYVHWLEDKLINKLTIPVVVSSKFLCGKEKQHPLKRCEEQCGFCEGDK
jgi:hypothetical protein